MNQKICTHPDGCQSNEPRHCLINGCQEQNGNADKLTREEKAAEKYLKERYGTDDVPAHWIKTVSEYAAEKVAKFKEENERQRSQILFNSKALSKTLDERNEAKRILSDFLTGKSSLRLFKADARIFLSITATRKE